MSAMFEPADRPTGRRKQVHFLGQHPIVLCAATLGCKPSQFRKEGDLRDNLVPLIKKVQGKAKQKCATRNKPLLKDYLIGTDWDSNRAALEQAGKTILDKLAKDTLPGIKLADGAALTAACKAYEALEGEQAGEQTDLRTERGTLSELMEKIKAGRKEVQLAADSEWPASDKANAGIRQEFRLPLNRSLKA